MINSIWGFKIKQLATFNDKGKRLVVTAIKAPNLKITAIADKAKTGYEAYQVNIHPSFRKDDYNFSREIHLSAKGDKKIGEEIKANEVLKVGDKVKVTGITKGKGFQGVVKRWGFAGGPRTHGQSDRERAPGSIGQRSTPGRVWKGKKMPGHMGNKTKTITGLTIFKIDDIKNEIWVTGLVPGVKRGLLEITKMR